MCSAVDATTSIGLGYVALHLPAVLTFALPAMTHLASVASIWDRTRFTDPCRRRATRQGLLGIAGCLMVVSAIILHLRLGQWDIAMLITAVVSGAGPFTLAMLGPIGAEIIGAERGVAPIRPASVAARWRKLFDGPRFAELAAQHGWFAA